MSAEHSRHAVEQQTLGQQAVELEGIELDTVAVGGPVRPAGPVAAGSSGPGGPETVGQQVASSQVAGLEDTDLRAIEQQVFDLLRQAYGHFMQTDRDAYAFLMSRARELLAALPKRGRAWGEWLLVSTLPHVTDVQLLSEELREAERCMEGQSSCVLPPRASLLAGWYNPLAVVNPESGHADENADMLTDAVSSFVSIAGGGRGTDICCRAQLAFYRGDLSEARALAMNALDSALADGQELVALCAAELLAKVANHTSDVALWRYARSHVRSMADGTCDVSRSCREQAQAVSALLALSIGVVNTLPGWMESGDFGAVPVEWGYRVVGDRISYGTLGNALFALIEWHSYKGDPVTALNLAALLRDSYHVGGVVTNAYLDFLRAGCYAQLGDVSEVRTAVRRAVDQIAPDGLWLIAAEFVPAFGEDIYAVAAEFSEDAPRRIRAIGEGFWGKLEAFRTDALAPDPQRLTKREAQVAVLIEAGRSNSEIATALSISEKTAKRHTSNIYTKLGVNRRAQVAEAIRKAGHLAPAIWVATQEARTTTSEVAGAAMAAGTAMFR